MQLIAEGLSAERDGLTLFEHVHFALEEGQSLLVTGENGSGKSTLLRIIAGLLRPGSGQIRFEHSQSRPLRESLHYLGHQNAMKPALSVSENLVFWKDFDVSEGMRDQGAKVDEALRQVGLGGKESLPFGVLSTGQRRRVAIARLLLNHRPVWLLDEPTAGLDKPSTDMLAAEMQSHLARGGIIIAATHLPLGLDESRMLVLGGGA